MSGLFNKKGGSGALNVPKAEMPSRMPDPLDPAILEAQRRQREAASKRQGRRSTIMSDALRDVLGAG